MNLGFYYHVPMRRTEEGLLLPGYLAVFVDALAKEVTQLTLFLHEEKPGEMNPADTVLKESNISWVNLGPKTPAWHRSVFYRLVLKEFKPELNAVDVLLVRCPSPLAPYFSRIIKDPSRVVYYVVGDYGEGARHWKSKSIRQYFIKKYLYWNDTALKKTIKNKLLIVNSIALNKEYEKITKRVHIVKTTTLQKDDFYLRKTYNIAPPIKLLYTGRFDYQKGLKELITALSGLRKKGCDIELHMVGWEESSKNNIETNLKTFAKALDVDQHIVWHGKKKTGGELNMFYRDADIYVIPSYHEGFPRTIWEAMANSCPVIATKVGSIPYFLEHEKHALLIEPKDTDAIKDAILRLATDENLRRSLILNGFKLATENTIERQIKKLADLLRSQQEEV